MAKEYIEKRAVIDEINRIGKNWDGNTAPVPPSFFQNDLYELLSFIDSLPIQGKWSKEDKEIFSIMHVGLYMMKVRIGAAKYDKALKLLERLCPGCIKVRLRPRWEGDNNTSEGNPKGEKPAFFDEQMQEWYTPRFGVGDRLVSTKNPHLTYEVLAVGIMNEKGEPDYRVEIFCDGEPGILNKPHNIALICCSKVDEWAELASSEAKSEVDWDAADHLKR